LAAKQPGEDQDDRGGRDKDHVKFPTLPHPIRKQAERERERMRREAERDCVFFFLGGLTEAW